MDDVLTEEDIECLLRTITEKEIAKNPEIVNPYRKIEHGPFDEEISDLENSDKEVNYFNY